MEYKNNMLYQTSNTCSKNESVLSYITDDINVALQLTEELILMKKKYIDLNTVLSYI